MMFTVGELKFDIINEKILKDGGTLVYECSSSKGNFEIREDHALMTITPGILYIVKNNYEASIPDELQDTFKECINQYLDNKK